MKHKLIMRVARDSMVGNGYGTDIKTNPNIVQRQPVTRVTDSDYYSQSTAI